MRSKKAIEKINDKPLSRLTKIKREDPNKIRNERGEITANITEIKNTVRKYYEQLYANKVDNVEEMFLEAYGLLKLNLEETDNLNRPMTRSEI